MPIRGSDPIADVLGHVYLSPRERNFAWMFVAHATQYFQLFNAAHLPDDVIANFLKGDEQLRANLINAFNYSLVPECHLDWVFESDRQSSWIGVALSQPSRFQNLRIVPQYL